MKTKQLLAVALIGVAGYTLWTLMRRQPGADQAQERNQGIYDWLGSDAGSVRSVNVSVQ